MEPTIKLTVSKYSEITQDIEKIKKVVEELYTKVYDQDKLIKKLEYRIIKKLEYRINIQRYSNS